MRSIASLSVCQRWILSRSCASNASLVVVAPLLAFSKALSRRIWLPRTSAPYVPRALRLAIVVLPKRQRRPRRQAHLVLIVQAYKLVLRFVSHKGVLLSLYGAAASVIHGLTNTIHVLYTCITCGLLLFTHFFGVPVQT
ncbi:hypothetical protein PF008_g24424 [Phytophthora fragariae]|uniref:Uncharacterized protein n=1 Tax=Phytophthora fragariae TaxID=53985 RepID=A0A6G0QNW9_9STRA|nr:hypothetical protein PF008_g24424 [Phytophthora fragariae]